MPYSVGSGFEIHFPNDWYTNSPKCLHGPMLLFEKYVAGKVVHERYYACSACRNHKDCNAFMLEDDFKMRSTAKEKVRIPLSIEDNGKPSMRSADLLSLPPSKRLFCNTCQMIIPTQSLQCQSHPCYKHQKIQGIHDQAIHHPSKFLLSPLESNKSCAQYFLSKRSIDFVLKTIHRLHFTAVICVGLPTLHEEIQSNASKSESLPHIDSILLDIDDRFDQFFGPQRYCKFNMFNRHFFDDSLKIFESFLKSFKGEKDKICLVLDPPFGGLVDALTETIFWLSKFIGTVTEKYNCDLLPTFWIFPYFMENRIANRCPTLKLLDYEMDYDNHRKFKKKNGSSISPVRIFTNVKQNLVVLPEDEGYRFCPKCDRFVARLNKHCDICGICPSKDGRPYLHCIECGICVKSSRLHCKKCDRCELPDHKCNTKHILTGCHLCGQPNHKRKDCHLQGRTMQYAKDPDKANEKVSCHTNGRRKGRRHPYDLSFHYRSSHMKKYYKIFYHQK